MALYGDGLDQRQLFYLLPEYIDAGKLAEKFSIDLRTALGQRVPWGDFVQVSLNGTLQGLYLDMRKVRIQTLSEFGWDLTSHFYTCGDNNCEMTLGPRGTYQKDFEFESDENGSQEPEMASLLQLINRTDDSVFESRIARKIDLDAYLGYLASNALLSATTLEDAKGWWVHLPTPDLWEFVPWELDHTALVFARDGQLDSAPDTDQDLRGFSIYDSSVQKTYDSRKSQWPDYQPTWSVLNTRLWRRPTFRETILTKIEAALDGPFAEGSADARLDALAALTASALRADPMADAAHAAAALPYYEAFVKQRAASLRAQIAQLRAATSSLSINEIGLGDETTSAYVELYNSGTDPVGLGGLSITDDLRKVQKQVLSSNLSIPAGGFLVLLADGRTELGPNHLSFTLSSSGGELGLFDGTHVYGPLDLMYFGAHAAGTAYGRYPDGSDTYRTLKPTPGSANQR